MPATSVLLRRCYGLAMRQMAGSAVEAAAELVTGIPPSMPPSPRR